MNASLAPRGSDRHVENSPVPELRKSRLADI
jgi:hypothetical protein